MSSESYTPGHTSNAVQFMARRSLETHGGFVRPFLRAGLTVLDCGCGPGAITIGIARAVAPGEVIGVDAGGAQLEEARAKAREAGVAASFQEASVYALPFPDGTFDGVFAHALFEHLQEPLRALEEVHRVLKPGGFAALRSPDWGGFVLHPWDGEIEEAIEAYRAMQTQNGGDVLAGRKLASWLGKAGFLEVRPSASYEIYPSARVIAEYLAQQFDRAGSGDDAQRLRRWSEHPEAQFAQAWFEAVGLRE